MNSSHFRSSINSAFSRMRELQLTDWGMFPNQNKLNPNSDFLSKALDRNSSYEEIYQLGMGLLHYNFMLSDYSYFQFYMDRYSSTYRYAFYSTPFDISESFTEFSQQMISEGEYYGLGDMYLQLLDEAELKHNIPPVRYDFDPDSYKESIHPAGHLHIGVFQGSRIAVKRLLSPLTFTLFIAKCFYPSNWSKNENQEKDENGFINPFDYHLAQAKHGCNYLDDNYFSEIDESLPFLD